MIPRTLSVVLVAAVLSVSLVACGDEEAEASLCDSLSGFQSSVSDLRDLDDDSSKEELEAARDDVGEALDQVISDASDLAGVRLDGLQSAFGDLRTAIDDLPDDTSISDAVEELEPQLDSIGTAFQAIFAGLNCDE